MFIFISNKHLNQLENIMSKFLDDFRAALEKVAAPGPNQAAIDALTARLNDNDATDADQSTAINELVNKLAVSTPPEA